jgi:hypothetical protein
LKIPHLYLYKSNLTLPSPPLPSPPLPSPPLPSSNKTQKHQPLQPKILRLGRKTNILDISNLHQNSKNHQPKITSKTHTPRTTKYQHKSNGSKSKNQKKHLPPKQQTLNTQATGNGTQEQRNKAVEHQHLDMASRSNSKKS